MRRGKSDSVPSFPEIKDQLGYNPARFLVPTDVDIDHLAWETRVRAFIRGMDDVETVRAWLRVEAVLGEGPNGRPREKVVIWLNKRQKAIEGWDISVDEMEDTDASVRDETTDPVDELAESPPSADTETTEALTADGGTTPDETLVCSTCRGELTREEIAGQTGYWCHHEGEFRDPVTTEARA